MPVIREQDILEGIPGIAEELTVRRRDERIQNFIEKIQHLGKPKVNFGKSVYVRGEYPNREWTNVVEELYVETPEEIEAKALRQQEREAVLKQAEIEASVKERRYEEQAKELSEMKALLADFIKSQSKATPPKLNKE
jgi:hypothetical protein